jgi:hypothetical protein
MPKKIALATKHGKLTQIAPAFESLRDWQIELVEIDTDVYGTFSGEVPRLLAPREAAIEKARAGALHAGCDFGLASEGTIGPHPQIPFINADLEVMAFVDLKTDFAVVETLISPEIQAYSSTVNTDTDIEDLIAKLDLPAHAANVTINIDGERQFIKGIHQPEELRRLVADALGQSATVEVENDFRAMSSPSRQANIAALAEKLAARLGSNCPACKQIGWGSVGFEYGLPCSDCFEVVASVAHSEKLGCVTCDHSELRSLGRDSVDPARCERCNP